VPTTCEVTNDKQCQFAHTFSQDLDWFFQITMTKVWYAGMIQYIKCCCSDPAVLYTSLWCCQVHENTTLTNNDSLLKTNNEFPLCLWITMTKFLVDGMI
jgi:hypothetical protein